MLGMFAYFQLNVSLIYDPMSALSHNIIIIIINILHVAFTFQDKLAQSLYHPYHPTFVNKNFSVKRDFF